MNQTELIKNVHDQIIDYLEDQDKNIGLTKHPVSPEYINKEFKISLDQTTDFDGIKEIIEKNNAHNLKSPPLFIGHKLIIKNTTKKSKPKLSYWTKDLNPTKFGLDFINDLRTVRFQWKPSNEFPKEWNDYSEENNMDTDVIMHGFIAQEVKEAMDKAGHPYFTGWSEGDDGMQELGEVEFITPLVKAVQELSSENKELRDELNELKIFIKKKLGDE